MSTGVFLKSSGNDNTVMFCGCTMSLEDLFTNINQQDTSVDDLDDSDFITYVTHISVLNLTDEFIGQKSMKIEDAIPDFSNDG
jgi:hypothetical protein